MFSNWQSPVNESVTVSVSVKKNGAVSVNENGHLRMKVEVKNR